MTFSMVNGLINVHVCSLFFNDVVFIVANYEAMRKIFHNGFHLRSYVGCSSLFCNAANNDSNEKDLFVSAIRTSQSINYCDFIFVTKFIKHYFCSDLRSHYNIHISRVFQECLDITEIALDSVSIQCRILTFSILKSMK